MFSGLLVVMSLVFGAGAAFAGTGEAPLQLVQELVDATQGQAIVLAGLHVPAVPHLPVLYMDFPNLLVFSDAPEDPDSEGVLYVDALPAGRARLYQYQINGAPDGLLRFPIVLVNNGPVDAVVVVEARGVAGPSHDYRAVANEAGLELLGPQDQETLVVPAGEAVVLDAEHAGLEAASEELITGIFDVWFSVPLEVYFLAVRPGTNPLEVYQDLPVFPHPRIHARGTFATYQRLVTMPGGMVYDTADGVQQIILGWDTLNDPNVEGIDATDGSPVELRGNFGVTYNFLLRVRSTDGRHLAILVNPLGGYHTSVVDMPAGATPGGVFTASVYVPGVTAGVLGRYELSEEEEVISFVWMTAGASYLPVRLLLVPYYAP